MTTATPTVHAAWAAVMTAVGSVAKTDRNREQGFDFRGVDAVVNAVGPELRKHKLIVVPKLTSLSYGEILVGRNRTPMGHAQVRVEWTVFGPAGDSFTGLTPGEAMDSGDKATAKAMSVAYRIFLLQALCLPTTERDPDHDAYERAREEVRRDWVEQARKSTDYEELRTIWTTARAGGASAAMLEEIAKLGEQLTPKDEEKKTEEAQTT